MKYSSNPDRESRERVSMVTPGRPHFWGRTLAAALLGLHWNPTDIASAPTTRARRTSEPARVVARSEVPLGGMVTGLLESYIRVLKSADPQVERRGAQVFSVQFADPEMQQSQVRRGHMIVNHADGDRTFVPSTSAVPASVADEVAGYVEVARRYEPPDARYLINHRGHLVFVKPEEWRFVTAT